MVQQVTLLCRRNILPSCFGRSAFIGVAVSIPFLTLLLLSLAVDTAFGQDEQCRTSPEPQCQCACRQLRSAISFAPRGTCRVIEPGESSCQLRWLDAARDNNEKLVDPVGAGLQQREFLRKVRDGKIGTKASDIGRGALSVEALVEVVKRQDRRLPPDPTPFEAAAAYLALDPEKQEPELLLTCYIILLGLPVQQLAGDKAADGLVDFLALEIKGIFERIRSRGFLEPRPYESASINLVDESARGCLELTIKMPRPMILMIKTPQASGRQRCRE